MEKQTYSNFPEQISVNREDNLFFIHLWLCGLDLLPIEGKPPYSLMEGKMREKAWEHNRNFHFPSLKLITQYKEEVA